jgi:hypothetical protein
MKNALQLVAANPEIQAAIQLQLQMVDGFKGASDLPKYTNGANIVLEFAQELSENDYRLLTQSSLVSICSAYEHLAKSILVEWAEFSPGKVSGLDTIRLTVQASEFIDSDLRDRLFLMADKIFLDISANKGHLEKARLFIRNHLPHLFENFDAKIDKGLANDFNEAFLIRNCIVHHGAKANRVLSQRDGFDLGKPICVTYGMLKKYFSSVLMVGEGLYACSFLANAL